MQTSVMSCDEASPFPPVARLEPHLIAASCIPLAATDAVTLEERLVPRRHLNVGRHGWWCNMVGVGLLTRVMLTTPVGPVRLPVWKAEMFVLPLVKEPGLVVGVPANSGLFPPSTDAIVSTVGS